MCGAAALRGLPLHPAASFLPRRKILVLIVWSGMGLAALHGGRVCGCHLSLELCAPQASRPVSTGSNGRRLSGAVFGGSERLLLVV